MKDLVGDLRNVWKMTDIGCDGITDLPRDFVAESAPQVRA